jgi:Tfp pilus assembly protein PilO
MSDVTARLKAVIDKLAEKKATEEAIKADYKTKAKVKALNTAERLDLIEKILGIV